MTEEKLNQIERKLDILINLMAYQMVKDMTIAEGAPILKRLGFQNAEIAAIFDTTRKTVSVSLAQAKKKNQ